MAQGFEGANFKEKEIIMTSYEQQVRIKTVDDMVETMDKIMFGMEEHYFTHEYHQVLQIHNEVNELSTKVNELDDKLDKVLGMLSYLCTSDNEKKFMFPDGSTNYDAICKSCDDISKEMLEMRDK